MISIAYCEEAFFSFQELAATATGYVRTVEELSRFRNTRCCRGTPSYSSRASEVLGSRRALYALYGRVVRGEQLQLC